MPFKDRLKEIRKESGKTQKEMAKSCGVGYSTFQRYEEGKDVPGKMFFVELALQEGINIHWLLMGDGDKKWYNNPSTNPMLREIWEWLESEEKQNPVINEWFRKEFEKRFPEFIDFKKNK